MMHGRGKSDPAIVAVKSTLLANIYLHYVLDL